MPTKQISIKHILITISDEAATGELYSTGATSNINSQLTAQHLVQLVAAIRPGRVFAGKRKKLAMQNVEELITLLENNDEWRNSLRSYISGLFSKARHISLYTESGVLPQSGFFSEGFQKITHLLLPPVYDETSLRGLVNLVFCENDDHVWLASIDDDVLVRLLIMLGFDGLGGGDTSTSKSKNGETSFASDSVIEVHSGSYHQLLNAAFSLSHKIAAMGLEPEITARLPEFDESNSPFVAQHRDLAEYMNFIRTNNLHPLDADSTLDDQALVMLGQCDDCIGYIRRRRDHFGASLSLSYQMQRITQHTRRLRTLIRLTTKPEAAEPRVLAFRIVAFWKEVVAAENLKHSLSKYAGDLIGLLAFQVAENAAKRGEHYITTSRKEYVALGRSALSGGAVVAFLALLKLFWYYRHLPPFGEAFCYGMTYSCGFVLIHIIGGTLATKQPAMTASALANALDTKNPAKKAKNPNSVRSRQSLNNAKNANYNAHNDNRKTETIGSTPQTNLAQANLAQANLAETHSGQATPLPLTKKASRRNNDVSLQSLVVMISQISRSQLVSFVGNVGMSFPTALLVAWLLTALGLTPADTHKAEKMITELHPLTSGSLFYASIAGVFLFVTGLLAGVYDNMVVHNRIGERLRQHPLLRRFLAKHTLNRFAGYIEQHLGAMAGNFFLGLLLGSAATIGFILGLPIDIRHITFAAANLAIALVSLDFAVEYQSVAWAVAGIIGIGVMNFAVSFTLALTVAMRSRRVTFRQTGELVRLLGRYLRRNGTEFLFPPKSTEVPTEAIPTEAAPKAH